MRAILIYAGTMVLASVGLIVMDGPWQRVLLVGIMLLSTLGFVDTHAPRR